MVNICLIGAGKMGISHLSILGAHPNVKVVGVCDTSALVLSVLKEYTDFRCFSDFKKMLDETKPDAAVVSVPTKFHAQFVEELLNRNIHVFVEKPFCLNPAEGEKLVQLADSRNLVNQVGYHNKFVGTFNEVKKILESGCLGEIVHFTAEAYGPVVTKKSQNSWRSKPDEGGGCLMDYASHVIDLLHFLIAPVKDVHSSILKSIFSSNVDDSVYALLTLQNGVSGVLSVNWSDITYRKMSTSISIQGNTGKIISDANELKVFFNTSNTPPGYTKGWNVKYITELASPVAFYLRGEEYSLQIDCFINKILGIEDREINSFSSALQTDKSIQLIKQV